MLNSLFENTETALKKHENETQNHVDMLQRKHLLTLLWQHSEKLKNIFQKKIASLKCVEAKELCNFCDSNSANY